MRQLVMAVVLSSGCVAGVAQAHEAGDYFLRVGVAQVAPDASSGTVLGGGVDVDNGI
jgi:outer membrane protein